MSFCKPNSAEASKSWSGSPADFIASVCDAEQSLVACCHGDLRGEDELDLNIGLFVVVVVVVVSTLQLFS